MMYKPMNDNGLHHMLWLSVSLDGHVSLGDGEVRGWDGDGVTTEITVLGGGGNTAVTGWLWWGSRGLSIALR